MSFAPRPSPARATRARAARPGSRAASGRRVASSIAAAPASSACDVDPLQRRRQEAHGARHRRAPADPVPHREAREQALRDAPAGRARCRSCVTATACCAKSSPRARVGGRRLEHAVARLRGAAGLRDDDDERLGEPLAEAGEHAVDAVGVGVVEEVRASARSSGAAEGVGDELRPERRAADADHEQVAEALGRGRRGRGRRGRRAAKSSHALLRVADLGRDLRRRARAPGRAASSGRPCASRRGWRSRPARAPPSPRAPGAGPARARVERAAGEARRGSGRAGRRGRGRRTAGSCRGSTAREASSSSPGLARILAEPRARVPDGGGC